MSLIYIAQSKTSKKMYVGKTRLSLRRRLNGHMTRKGTALYRAIKKYGIKDFEFITLDEVPEEISSEWESFFIRELGTLAPGGYNLTTGGEGGRMAPEVVEKLRVRMKGIRPPLIASIRGGKAMLGRKYSPEHRKNISEGKIKAGTKRPDVSERQRIVMIGKKYHLGHCHSEETKRFLREHSVKGKTWRIIDGKRTWFPRVA